MKANEIIKITTIIVLIISGICVYPISSSGIYDLNKGLLTNYPNPFDSRYEATSIVYKVSGESQVKMKIYDLFGNLVREYQLGGTILGTNKIVWDGTNEAGQKVAKGGYICVLEVSNESNRIVSTRKIGVIH